VGCTTTQSVSEKKPFVWEAASVYFLMTDRFNGDKSNDTNFNRKTTGKLRGFEGGDTKSEIDLE
jgi:alpha-amylase